MQFVQKHIMLFLFLLGICVYLPSLGNSFVWDDEQFITRNIVVQHIISLPIYFVTNTTEGSGQSSNYYRPLTTISFAIDAAVWGMHPFFFHLTNTLLHALAGALVFAVLYRILKKYTLSSKPRMIAGIVAAYFLLHPVQVEAVVYANSRGDSLSAVFGLLMVLCYVKLPTIHSGNKKLCAVVVSLGLFLCAVLSKESAIAWIGVPFLLLFLDKVQHHRLVQSQYVTAIAGFCTACVYMLLRYTVLSFPNTNQILWEAAYQQSVVIRLATFFLHIVPSYLLLLVAPVRLHMERMVPIISTSSNIVLPFVVIFVCFLITIMFLFRHFRPLVIFSIGWFFLFLLPISGVIPVNGLLYEHWLYIPMIGFWTLCAILAQQYLPKRIFVIVCIVLGLAWTGLSIRQMFIWKDPISLYTYTLQYADTARLHNNLGIAYADGHQLEKAIVEYQKSIAVSDVYPQVHHNLGNLYKELGKNDQAVEEFKKALNMNPSFPFSINALISFYADQKQYDQALTWAQYALKYYPQDQSYQQLEKQLMPLVHAK